mmetsp:Transcript_7191/g.23874  ORF Transcript_7191/g.23874 Transcript_7191/m.23874 type:complete len:121 (-) Transcript_7191:1299-1661(-)
MVPRMRCAALLLWAASLAASQSAPVSSSSAPSSIDPAQLEAVNKALLGSALDEPFVSDCAFGGLFGFFRSPSFSTKPEAKKEDYLPKLTSAALGGGFPIGAVCMADVFARPSLYICMYLV